MHFVDENDVHGRIVVYEEPYLQCGLSIPGGKIILECKVPQPGVGALDVDVLAWDEDHDHDNIIVTNSLTEVGLGDEVPWFTLEQRKILDQKLREFVGEIRFVYSAWQLTTDMRDSFCRMLVAMSGKKAVDRSQN